MEMTMTSTSKDTTQNAATRIALITGGSRGLGKSMALHLAERGYDIILTFKSASRAASAVVDAITAHGRKAVALPLDVANSSTFDAFAASVAAALERTWGRKHLDALVNNAGTSLYASIVETTAKQLDEVFAVHVKAPFLLTQRLLPLIHDGGRVLNVSSGLARMTMQGYGAYAAMKSAIETYTRYLAQELGPRKITANVIAPGAVATDFGGGMVRDNAAVNQHVASTTALGRVGLPDDIGAAVAMLLSPESGWINGQRIEASGGQAL
jgi:NAD(P)-dependent dehydrogenase (short-subunit alcohol dehydrogenase family)